MVVTQLRGGLGNQLFQYAAGRAISLREHVDLKLDCSVLESDPKRSFRMGAFQISARIANRHEITALRRIDILGARIPMRITKKLEQIKPRYSRRTLREEQFEFDHNFELIRSPVYLIGYWQSEKYFRSIREVLLDELKLRVSLSRKNQILLEEINGTNSVSIHVRRGDYVSDSIINTVHGLCSKDYYTRAIRIINQTIHLPNFFVFSDDVSWVRSNLDFGIPVTYVNHNGPERDYVDLKLMQACSHHIIANSSFSWWGAWLANERNKVVIAPKNWFQSSDRNIKDLLPKSWYKT